MQQEEKNKINQLSPAFPPQVAQDSLGRIFAAIPGMTKIEFFSIMMYPTITTLDKYEKGNILQYTRKDIYKLSMEYAQEFLNLLNEQNEKDNTSIIK